ncbi:hypothetical protein FNH07_29770 [Amycolatopsis bartoniae]|uniref:DUF4386 domain-containing protein n=2 Tax=Amycolatopsis bartoniae TaxID=941986 RepID=A0A8H9IM75_9PSEU|nr:hypothetical protein FNH07_29770 [Amycolatopsis bartoniae]GHF32595.1 hypothetical protein GCM10017566_01470 [Amycolatopsis bartoniae]
MHSGPTPAGSGRRWRTPALVDRDAWFPGRVIGGAALVLGPLVWWAGLFLRYLALHSGAFTAGQLAEFARQPFAAPSQLAAYLANPALVTAGYACFAAGALLLWPAFATLAHVVAARVPLLACWGGTLVVLSLFARLYFAGVDQTAFHLAASQGFDRASDFVQANYQGISYGPWRVAVTAHACQYLGTLLLAIGAFRSGTFGLGRCLLLLWAGTLWGGVLKAAHLADLFEYGALCLVLVPLGVRVLRDRVAELRAGPGPNGDIRSLRLLSW